MDPEQWTTIYLGCCFMILFSAEFTTLNLQKTIISSIQDERPDYQVEGYSVHGVTYSVTCLSFWLAPSVVSVTGPTLGMTLAALGYSIYMLALSLEQAWSVYCGAVVVGVSNSILWTAEGKYLVTNSTPERFPRNICIFWMLFMCAMFPGNIYAYFQLEGKKYLDRGTRRTILYVLALLAGLAAVMFSRLRKSKSSTSAHDIGPLEALGKTWALFTTKYILILCSTFCYTGLQQAFISGIYGPSIGFTLQFGEQSKQLVPLSGIFVGLGNFLGGAGQFMLSDLIHKITYCRSWLVLLAFVSGCTAYIIVFFNIPDKALFGNTYDHAAIESSKSLAVLCSFLLGLGDSLLNTQNFSILAVLHPESSSQSTAIYMLSKAMCVSLSFFCSSHLGLHTLLPALVSAALLSALAFCCVDRRAVKLQHQRRDTSIDLTPVH